MADTELDQLPPPAEQPTAELPAADLADAAMTAALQAHQASLITGDQSAYIYANEAHQILTRAAIRPAREGPAERTTAWLDTGRAYQAANLYRQLTRDYPPPAGLTAADAHPAQYIIALTALLKAKTATAAAARQPATER